MAKYFFLILLFFSVTCFAQRPGGRPGGPKDKGQAKGSISGKIVDAQTKKGMEYVTIALFKQSSLVTGTSTDSRGEFVIEKVEMGRYIVKSSFIGYDTRIDTVILTPGSPEFDLGKINLQVVGSLLNEVEISADKPLVKYEIDKKIVDVSNMDNVASQSAIEVLENVPSINVDIDGNVSLRGSSSFTLLIDGKPTTMAITDALKLIPANSIQEIEIITNPSARYDAEGVSGIINIVLKKNKLEGISSLINANVGTYQNYGGDFLVNFNRKNISLTVGGNYRTGERPVEITSLQRTTSDSSVSDVDYTGYMSRNFGGWGTNAELEWRPNRKSIFTLGGEFGERIMNSSSDLNITESLNENVVNNYHNLEDAKRNFLNYSINANYRYNFKGDKNHYFFVRGLYNSFNGNEVTRTEYFDANDVQKGGNINTEVGPSNMARFNLDYVRGFKNGSKLEVGGQSQIGISKDVTETFAYDTTAEDYLATTLYNANVDYYRNIHAGYAIYGGSIKKLGYQLGFRGEYTDRTISSTYLSGKTVINRMDYFPSAHFTYQLNKKNQLMANVSKRIQRPRSWYFEPFITWQNLYSVRTGNSNLIPEYIYAYEFGYIRNLKKGNFSVELYRRDVQNKIQRVRSIYSANVIITKPENIGTESSTGAEISYGYPIAKWWKSEITGNAYLYQVTGELEGQSFANESFSYNGRWNNTFSVKGDWKIQMTAKYNSAVVTAQGNESDKYSMDASVKKNVKEGKYSFSLQVRDVFSTTRTLVITESNNFYGRKLSEPKTPTVVFSVSVKLNNYNKKLSETDSSDEF